MSADTVLWSFACEIVQTVSIIYSNGMFCD